MSMAATGPEPEPALPKGRFGFDYVIIRIAFTKAAHPCDGADEERA